MYHTANILFIVFSVLCAVSSNIHMLVAFRFFNGMAVAAVTLNPSVVGDLFVQEERGSVLAVMMGPSLLGAISAPVIGAFVDQAKGWRWVFWLAAIAGAAIELGFLLFFRESYKVVILKRKAKRLRKQNGDPEYRSSYDHSEHSKAKLFRLAIVRPVQTLVHSPIVLFLSSYVAVVYGYAYLVMSTITEVFEANYSVTEGTVGLMFLGRGQLASSFQ